MDQSVLFVVDNDRLHHFVTRDDLGADVVSVLQSDLGVTVGETVLPIAHWEHDRTGPLSVAVNFAGELVVLVVAETFTSAAVLMNTLSTLEQWLAPMGLHDLGELSGDPARFREGLSELSPRTPLNLASMMRFLLINPTLDVDPATTSASLPFSRIEVLRIEALEATDGTLTIRRSHERSDSFGDNAPASEGMPITIHLGSEPKERNGFDDDITVLDQEVADAFADETFVSKTFVSKKIDAEILDAEEVDAEDVDVEEVAAEEVAAEEVAAEILNLEEVAAAEVDDSTSPDIDLTHGSSPTATPEKRPTVIRGSHYVTAELPLHFDPTGSRIEPISDELFAVGSHLALVIDLDEYDESPIETASIFRWDSSPGQRELFSFYELDATEQRRSIHIFVESSTGPNRVFYLGTASQLAQSGRSQLGTMWFRLNAPIDGRWLSQLLEGTMPRPQSQTTMSTSTRSVTSQSAPTASSGLRGDDEAGNWVPNV